MEDLDTTTLRKIAAATRQIEAELKTIGPQNPDQLHAWIKENIGVDIPRVSVCKHTDPVHCAPFDFLSDLYFEKEGSALAMANRGGGKTFLVAVLHYVNALFKPGIEVCTFGAVENQSDRCYEHLKHWIFDDEGEMKAEFTSSLRKVTKMKNGSMIYVLGSTPEQVNGPHPQKAHADEVELMREDTWTESRNMAVSKRLKDGRLIKPQDILTSTRKGPRGRMQELIDLIKEAEQNGTIAPYKLYAWCIYEDASQVPNCREAPENAHLPEFESGMNPDNCKCRCNEYAQGFWDSGNKRYLNEACGGKLYKSRGFKPYEDITNTFMQNSRAVWEAQQECAKPHTENMILPQFSEVRNVIRHYLPNPKNGPIYMGVDWGGTAANAVSWYQLTESPVQVMYEDHKGDMHEKIIPANSLVCFDELYHEDWPPSKLGREVHRVEDYWRDKLGPDFQVQNRFTDPQGRGARNEWAQMPRALKTQWLGNKDVEQQITYLHELLEDERFYVDGTRCPMFIAEAVSWRRDPNTGKEVRDFNHQMSAFRYAVANIRVVNNRILKKKMAATSMPVASTDRTVRESPVPVSVANQQETEYEKWRKRFSAGPNVNVIDFPGNYR